MAESSIKGLASAKKRMNSENSLTFRGAQVKISKLPYGFIQATIATGSS